MECITTPHYQLRVPLPIYDETLFNYISLYEKNEEFYISNLFCYFEESKLTDWTSYYEHRRASVRMNYEHQQSMFDLIQDNVYLGYIGFIRVNRVAINREAFICIHVLNDVSCRELNEIFHVLCKIASLPKFDLTFLRIIVPRNKTHNLLLHFVTTCGFEAISKNEYIINCKEAIKHTIYKETLDNTRSVVAPINIPLKCITCEATFLISSGEYSYFVEKGKYYNYRL